MTAVNAIAAGARGRMVTDSAAYAPDGALVGFVTKAIALPHLGLVLASRGASWARWALAEEVEAFASLDAVIADGGGALYEAHEGGAFGEDFDLVIMGWSEGRGQVELYSLSSLPHAGLSPFVFHAMRVSLAPLPDDDALRRVGLKVGMSWDASRPETKLVEVIEVQRRTPAPLGASPGAPVGYGVGGAAILTEVSEVGISQRVLRRWPDVIGQRLTPEGCDPAPAVPHLRIVA